ncbi:MAG TPA: hypothetical protein V6C97_11580 [Oculatellaceae cyanobacterium]
MVKRAFALSIVLSSLLALPSLAQSMNFDPSSGVPFQETQIDGAAAGSNSQLQFQANQITGIYMNPFDQSNAQTVHGLPPTSMDSFVYEAGGMAESIYGDEGTTDIPPYFGFDASHRINAGIAGTRAAGLTTGHGSYLPDAWGGDEFVGPEWSMSGSPYPNAPGVFNLFGIQFQAPNVNIPGLPGGLPSLVGGTNGIFGTNSGF